jgi:hypothetical protein
VKRPQLEAMQGFVREGDTEFCHSMDRLARNLDDLRRIVLGLTERGVHIVFDLIVRIKEQPRPDGYLGGGHDEVDAPIVARGCYELCIQLDSLRGAVCC